MATLPNKYLSTIPVSSSSYTSNRITVPGRNQAEGMQFLRSVASGSTLGTGTTFIRDVEKLRLDYNSQISTMGTEIEKMRAEGKASSEIAEWAVAKRLSIARSIRMRQNPGAVVSLELRDYYEYGFGGRTINNLTRRAENSTAFKESGLSMEEYLIKGAMKSNKAVTGDVARAARYLRFGSPILLTLGAGLSVYDVASAKPEDRGRVVAEEAGGWAGGWLASGAAVAVGVFLVPATGGLSLVAVGFLAGLAGGIGGSLLADKIYYSSHPHLVPTVHQAGELPCSMVQSCMPPPPVCPRCHPLR